MNLTSDRDHVLFLGAGFSWAAGLPTMKGFGDASEKELKRLMDWNKPEGARFCRAGAVFQKFQHFCARGSAMVSVDLNNMEDLFCIAEMLAQSGVIIRLADEEMTAEELVHHVKVWLWKIYQKLPPYDDVHYEKSVRDSMFAPYVRLFQGIRETEFASRLVVVSTNYDLVVECAALKSGLRCVYPKADSPHLDCFEPMTTKGPIGRLGYLDFLPHGRAIIACKLHGSINLFEHSSTGTAKVHVADGFSGTSLDFPEILQLRSLTQLEADGFSAAIIPPTYAKLRKSSWLELTWRTAFLSVRNARKLVFVGYSLPPSDGFVRALLQGAIASRERPEALEIVVLDPCVTEGGEVRKRFESLFAPSLPSRVEFIPRRFEDAVDLLAAELS